MHDNSHAHLNGGLLQRLWVVFNCLPECNFKMRLRFFMAFSRFVPTPIRRMSPIRASIEHYTPQPGDTVVDGGAFPGDFTIFASRRVGPSGRVFAFEPNPKNFACLQRQVAAFGCSNVVLVPKGLWHSDCSMRMSGTGVSVQLSAEGEHSVELVALDAEMKRLGVARVDFLKLDIEGAEPEALKGGMKTLMKNCVHLAVACYHDYEGHETRGEIERVLRSAGYDFEVGCPERPNLYAQKKP
jgi:FkbM family methyltransferase